MVPWYDVSFVCRLSVTLCTVAKRYVVGRGSAIVPLDRALASSYRLSIVTMSLSAAVWPQFATKVFGAGILRYIGSYVSKKLTTFTYAAFGCRQYSRLPLPTAVFLSVLCLFARYLCQRNYVP